ALPICLLLVAVALAGGVVLATQLRETAPVVVAARELPPGHVITRDDLALSEARLEGPLAGLAVGAAEITTIVGQTAAQTIHAGALVVRPDLGSGPVLAPGEMAITVAVGADAVFADLRRGDQVAVLETSEPGRPGSATRLLLDRATVYHVALDATRVGLGGGSTESGGRITNVTLVVPRADAERLTHGLVTGRLTLALVPAVDAEAGTR
ncbi:MAG: hypothetical protein EPO65_07595, partial [Dehalococcoidia bacterium]